MSDLKVEDILHRIKKEAGLMYDKDVAALLGAKNPTRDAANWKSRESIPWDLLVDYCREHDKSLDHLVLGRYAEPGQSTTVQSVNEQSTAQYNGIDLTFFNHLLKLMTEQAEARNLDLPPLKLLEATALLYHQTTRDAEPDMQLVGGLLELTG
ncbi:MAG: helix-turn-helix domain-containing protein [Gammaproteobacteria bacterium]|nr:helix-turn-helix domain-containing protein [Gammaproteobacteria bacterium]